MCEFYKKNCPEFYECVKIRGSLTIILKPKIIRMLQAHWTGDEWTHYCCIMSCVYSTSRLPASSQDSTRSQCLK